MIEIKDISGRVKLSVSIGTGSVRRFELMKEDYVNLVFSLSDPVQLEIGDNIDYEGSVFYVTGKTYPTFNASTGGYDYSVRFDSHYYRWKNHILFYDRQGNKEASWSLTRAPEAHLSIVVSNLRSLGFRYNGKEYQAVVDSSVDAVAKLVQYDSTNIVDALTKIAEAWECEWWVEGDKIYIGRIERGDPVDLEIGRQVVSMPRSQSQDLFATRLYAFGSTRNIPSGYRKGESGTVVQGVVQKRLMLPKGTPYVDVVQGLTEDQIVEAVVIFDDIYPRKIGTITEVIPKEVTEESEDGTSETFTVYRFKDSGLSFSEEYVLPGKELRVVFQTGPLSGMDFALRFNPEGLPEDDPEAQVFEIVRNDSYGQTLPESPLIPGTGNKYILYNFDTQYVSDTLIPQAEEELLRRTIEYKAKVVSDPSTYTCVLNSYYASGYDENNGILNPEKAIDLSVGQRVRLINKAYFENGRESRVLGFEKKLDIPYDSPSYTVGESAAYSRLGELERKLENIQYKDNTYVNQGSGSFGVYIIKKEDTTAASDENVFSALRTLYEINKVKQDNDKRYLRKDIPDIAHEDILFDKKIGSSIFLDGMDGKGWEIKADGRAIFDESWFRGNVLFKKRVGSHTFISGFPNGFGWDIAPYKRVNSAGVEEQKFRLEIDDINVRGSLRVYEFIVSQLRGENDNVIFSGMMKVEYYDHATGRIYLDTGNGVLYNPFRSGDILMVQHFGGMPTGENDYNIIKQYELRVDQVGIGNLSDGEDRLDWITFVNFAGDKADIAQGDVLTRIDSVADSTRKGIVKITTIDEIGAPYMDVVYGMKTDPDNATKARIGNLSGIRTKNGIDLTGVWGIYGNGAYFENSTYILDTGNTVEQEFSIMNGKFESSIEGIRNDISLEPGNILKNSSFSQNTDYWVTENSISFWGHDGSFIYANDSFLSEKRGVSDIYQDGNRNVLRISDSYILQRNDVINIPSHETEATEYDYSFSLHYRVVKAGILTAGFEGSSLYVSMSLEPSSSYRKLSKAGKWDERGDFRISFDGEILIYGVSLFIDNLADAIIRLETRIEQTEESIKLAATKDYVDEETGKVYTKYDSQLNITAGQISAISTRVDNIRNEIDTAGWINTTQGNTLFAAKSLENGDNIISYINQTATTTTIKAERINLVGAVTFNMFNTDVKNTINNASSNASSALSKANEALSDASSAWSKASSAESTASTAYSNASKAIQDAATAISNAAKAVTTAGSAQEAINNLPAWSKEASIIKALTSATVIVNGYIKTSMIDVDNLYATSLDAVRGTIGGFTINNNQLYGTTSNEYYGSYKMYMDSSRCEIGISDSNESTYKLSVGYNYRTTNDAGTASLFIKKSLAIRTMVEVPRTAIKVAVTNADDSNMVKLECESTRNDSGFMNFLYCEHGIREIQLGTKKFSNDSPGIWRTVLRMDLMPSVTQVNTESTSGTRYNVKWDSATGLLYIE